MCVGETTVADGSLFKSYLNGILRTFFEAIPLPFFGIGLALGIETLGLEIFFLHQDNFLQQDINFLPYENKIRINNFCTRNDCD